MRKISTPLQNKQITKLKSGDKVLLSGIIYTARDQAHRRLISAIKQKKKLPFDLEGQVIYYCGPNLAPKPRIIDTSALLSAHGVLRQAQDASKDAEQSRSKRSRIIGSCGPTTSSRMDEFSPKLLKLGLSGMIGKGRRSPEVAAAIKKYRAVYFLTYSGCGALLSKYVKETKLVAYQDLGPEAIYKLRVKDFPVIVGIDSYGNDIYI